MNEKLARNLGWLGLVSLLSYTAAVVFSPLAYPGYDWMAQAVSDLSADTAPSRVLWNRLGALYMPCGIVCVTLCCITVKAHFNRAVRAGVYLFALMNWVSAVGYAMFPLTQAGISGRLQDVMHQAVTAAVVLLVHRIIDAHRLWGSLAAGLPRAGRMGAGCAGPDARRGCGDRRTSPRVLRHSGAVRRVRVCRLHSGTGRF